MPADHPWHDFYTSDLQAVWGLWIVPLLFLAYRAILLWGNRGLPSAGVTPAAARFVDRFAIVFALLTLADPFCTGPLTRWLGLADTFGASAIAFVFVYLGDFRVFVLFFGVAAIAASQSVPLVRAALFSLVVPAVAGLFYATTQAVLGEAEMGWLWVSYEASFLVFILGLRRHWIPRHVHPNDPGTRHYLRFLCNYVATYYALWLLADLLILVFHLDLGWALRVVPNQLYYAFFIPVLWFRFFASRYAPTSASTQNSR